MKNHKENCQCCSCKAHREEYREKNAFWTYIDGRTLKEYYCKNPTNNPKCKVKISYQCALYGSGLCKSCINIGKKLTDKHKNKISEWSKKYGFQKGHKTNIGKIPWNKDKNYKWSEEAIERNKNSSNYFQEGEKHYLWKNGISPLGLLIRNSDEYKRWRISCLKRDNFSCVICGNTNKKVLRVHHKKLFFVILKEFLQEYSQFSPIEDKETLVRLAMTYEPFWEVNNGETRCLKCHKHEFYLYNKKRDNNGRFV